jgi:hypothetical protein
MLMATFETLPHFEEDWKKLTPNEQAAFRAVVLEAFEPDLKAPGRQFRPGLRVRPVAGCPGLFEMTWAAARRMAADRKDHEVGWIAS